MASRSSTSASGPAYDRRLAVAGGVASVAVIGPDNFFHTFEGNALTDLVVIRGDGAVLSFRETRTGGVVSARPRVLAGAPLPSAADAHIVSGRYGGGPALDVATVTADGRVAVTFGSLHGPPRTGPEYATGPGAGVPAWATS
jgi:hypothetical protein